MLVVSIGKFLLLLFLDKPINFFFNVHSFSVLTRTKVSTTTNDDTGLICP